MNSYGFRGWIGAAFRLLGGFLLGASLGIVLAFCLLYLLSLGVRGEGAWFLVGLMYRGVPTMAIIGGAAGAAALHRLRGSRWAGWISAAGYILVVGLMTLYAVNQSLGRAHSQRAQKQRDRAEADAWVAWERTYGDRYPQEEGSLPALLGPLLYPGSRLVQWSKSQHFGYRPAWAIVTETEDPLEKVLVYYMSVLPEGIGEEYMHWGPSKGSYVPAGTPQRSADGRRTEILMEEAGAGCRIRFKTYRPGSSPPSRWKSGGDVPDAWPEDRDAYLARVAERQETYRADIERAFGELLYPNSRLFWGRISHAATQRLPLIFVTEDPLVDVLAYYRARLGEPWGMGGEHIFDAKDAHRMDRRLKIRTVGTRVEIRFH